MRDINPSIWGTNLWKSLLIIMLAYTSYEDDHHRYTAYFNTLGYILPCNTCRDNYKKYMASNPLRIYKHTTPDDLVQWLVNLYNHTAPVKLTTDAFLNKYKSTGIGTCMTCVKPTTRSWNIGLLLIIMLLIIAIGGYMNLI